MGWCRDLGQNFAGRRSGECVFMLVGNAVTELVACLTVESHFVRVQFAGGFGCGRFPIGIIVSTFKPDEKFGGTDVIGTDVDI